MFLTYEACETYETGTLLMTSHQHVNGPNLALCSCVLMQNTVAKSQSTLMMSSLEGAWISITTDFGWKEDPSRDHAGYDGNPSLLWFTMMDIHRKLPVMDIHVRSRLMR